MVPRCGRSLHALPNSSRLQIIDGAGHCPHDEQAGLLNQLAIKFLTGEVEPA